VNYHFEQFTLDTKEYKFTEHGKSVSLEPRVFGVLAYLLEHHEHIVSKEELIDSLWDGRVITDSALNTCIRSVRRALSDDREKQAFIRTFPKRGFQFVGSVDIEEAADNNSNNVVNRSTQKPRKDFLFAALVVGAIFALVALQF